MKRKLKTSFDFLWYDFWVGFFYDTKKKILYFCPLPMCVFSFRMITGKGENNV